MRDRGVALPGEVAETVDKYALGGSKDLEAYLEAKRNVELMDEEIALGGVIAPEENKNAPGKALALLRTNKNYPRYHLNSR